MASMTPPTFQVPPVWATWKNWESVALTVLELPAEVNTYDLWGWFGGKGTIIYIDISEPRNNAKSGGRNARIRFKPPPNTDFWDKGTYPVVLRSGRPYSLIIRVDLNSQSPVVPSPEFKLASLDVGVLLGERSFAPLHGFKDSKSLNAVIDVKQRSLFIYFDLVVRTSQNPMLKAEETPSLYRARLKFFDVSRIWETLDQETKKRSLTIVLKSPALFYRQVTDFQPTFKSDDCWRSADTWYRQTAIIHHPLRQANISTNLRKSGHIIDLGRWNAFRITFSEESVSQETSAVTKAILKDHNIIVEDGSSLTEVEKCPPAVWDWIDLSESHHSRTSYHTLSTLYNNEFVYLPFSVRYQLEVCISHGLFSEFTLTKEFLLELMSLGEAKAQRLLEHVATKKKNYPNPMKVFALEWYKGVSQSRIPKYCCFMRTARVTPTTIYYNTPTVDTSNRVTRRYIEFADRFLRVRFTDEVTHGRINSCPNNSNDEIFTRVKRTMANGITIGDRHFEFLAFGNSQFREHGAYFFAPLPSLTAAHMRAWMGQFKHIRNIAKHSARLGQCFSTTRAISGSRVEIRRHDDIVRNDQNFSDGVGKISKFLAEMTMNELKIKTSTGRYPSAFQFRLGGCKGLLVVSSDPRPNEIHIRNSQFKFEAESNGLEIIRWSQFNAATLNRQLILVLSALGIPDWVIRRKLKLMLSDFDKAMQDDAQAIILLRKFVDPNEMTFKFARMVSDGFRRNNEPFVNSMLQLWRAWHLKYLKEKARIVIEKGASLFGCVDETGVLKGYFTDRVNKIHGNSTYEQKLDTLPEIFVQISRLDKDSVPEVIKGVCILARNPSLHAGDVRVVRAVDKPELRHLHNVVVLPQTGDRDIASMCSGGDLDGDDYLVVWDQDLIPQYWFTQPMQYTGRKAPDLDHDVTVDEITSFFVTYMKCDYLPRIAHAHMALADCLDAGVREEKCVRLAKLHSDAVDYNKTGAVAKMGRDLEPRFWPHFMEKKNKPMGKIYHSKKILGQLYDSVKLGDFTPNLNLPFDSRILTCDLVPESSSYLEFAKNLKAEYDDALRRIMSQYEIKTEFEVWSTFVLEHNSLCHDFKIHEDLGRMSSKLREGFRQACYEEACGRSFEDIAPLVVALYRVTQEDTSEALRKAREKRNDDYDDAESIHSAEDEQVQTPLISCPWIFHEFLGKIATGQYAKSAHNAEQATPTQPRTKTKVYSQEEVQELIAEFQNTVRDRPSDTKADDSLSMTPELSLSFSKATVEGSDSGINVKETQEFATRTGLDNGIAWNRQKINITNEKDEIRDESNKENRNVDAANASTDKASRGMDEDGDVEMGGEDVTDIIEEENEVRPNAVDNLLRMLGEE
ncbi:RNA-directed RNA polymerase (Sad-1) [Penicillium angulare]|uniref:RNA-dependent RNA polymerase n=1 Tax=Penicillium angulare TaxID=116970 RepID=A0A9W9GCE1_9EURO|nr:RNA-directed RNA polymerase (Sad-1) [Penicillium angulare]